MFSQLASLDELPRPEFEPINTDIGMPTFTDSGFGPFGKHFDVEDCPLRAFDGNFHAQSPRLFSDVKEHPDWLAEFKQEHQPVYNGQFREVHRPWVYAPAAANRIYEGPKIGAPDSTFFGTKQLELNAQSRGQESEYTDRFFQRAVAMDSSHRPTLNNIESAF